MFTILRVFFFVIAAAAPAMAATVDAYEADAPKGDFADNPKHATIFDATVATVSGGQRRKKESDFFVLSGVTAATEALDFTFTNDGTWGGLNLRLKATPFASKNDWWPLLAQETIDNVTASTPRKFSYILDGYEGDVHVAMDFWGDVKTGDGVSFVASRRGALPMLSPQPAAPAIPLPAGVWLSLSAFGTLAALRWRTRRG